MRLPVITLILSLILSVFTQGCRDHNGIQFYPSDSIDVYTRLKPNDELYSGRHTYGNDSVVGNTIKYRLSTDSVSIGVDIDITILDLHPQITANLLSFIHGEMIDHGFINESDTIVPFGIKEKSDEGLTQSEIVHMALDWEGERFYSELPQIIEYGENGYNIAFEIYPVFLNEDYVTYKKFSCYFTGGGHSNYSLFLQTYNRKTGESVDLEDMIDSEKLDKVRERVAYHMAAKYPIYSSVNSTEEYLDSLNRWAGLTDIAVVMGLAEENDREQITLKNYPINDPGLHGAGLVFTYEMYHLTPGCNGCPTIILTFDEIRDCLKEPLNQYNSDLNEFEKYKSTDMYADKASRYTGTQLDSVRAAWSPADDGNPWPRSISDWYSYRVGKLKKHYALKDILGTWIGYGHLPDSRQILSIKPNGMYINITEEALEKDSLDRMIYNYTQTNQGTYNYNSSKNLLMLKNWEDMKLKDETLEAYVKRRDPENKYLIIHSIENDTMYVADDMGNLWPFYRKKREPELIVQDF